MLNKLLGMPMDASEHGINIDQMLEFVHWKILILFVGWSIFFVYVLFRFNRRRNPKADYYGAKTKITTHVEMSVVVIEAVLLIGFAFPLWAKRVNQFPAAQDATVVRAIGQQFVWNFHYPGPDGVFGRQNPYLVTASNQIGLDYSDPAAKDDFVTLNDMHVPVDKPVIVQLMSKDVIHNYAIVNMRIAQDAIPGSNIPIWFTPVKTGMFEIICGQLCGLGHYAMRAVLTVDPEEDYRNWADQKVKAALDLSEKRDATPTPAEEAEKPAAAPEAAAHG
jgi:cytochrome c oxidase subunit 2